MSYKEALKLAGNTEVHLYEQYGSYQGRWLALVTHEGKTGWLIEYYGSCSGCDPFESKLGYSGHEHPDNKWFDPFWDEKGFDSSCGRCTIFKKSVVEFAEGYFERIKTRKEALGELQREMEWDPEAREMIEFIQKH